MYDSIRFTNTTKLQAALMAEPRLDPFAAFFTPERLAYYRGLHARYPLWCGDWPSNDLSKPSAHDWLVGTRLNDEVSKLPKPSRIIFVRFDSTPTDKQAPRPQIVIYDGTDIEVVEDIEPPIRSAVLGATNYAFARWRPAGPGGSGRPFAESVDSVLENWSWHAKEILAATDPRMFGVLEDPGLTGHALRTLRRAYLETAPKIESRAKKLKALEAYWLRIGREVGIIPGVKGGKVCALDDELLAGLIEEGEKLVQEILEYEPTHGDLDELRALVPAPDVDPNQILLREEMAKRFPEKVAAFDERHLTASDSDLGVAQWVTRLRFPMFSAAEIESIDESWRASPRKDRYVTLAIERMENRLQITASQIWKKTKDHRN